MPKPGLIGDMYENHCHIFKSVLTAFSILVGSRDVLGKKIAGPFQKVAVVVLSCEKVP